jgi:hypothetical protein
VADKIKKVRGVLIVNKADGSLSIPDRKSFSVFVDTDYAGHFTAGKSCKLVECEVWFKIKPSPKA